MEHAEYGTLRAVSRYIDMLEKCGAEPVESAVSGEDPTHLDHLLWMCWELQKKIHFEDMPVDKYSRWLGYIQGCIICNGLTTVQAERDVTRPWFTKGEPV